MTFIQDKGSPRVNSRALSSVQRETRTEVNATLILPIDTPDKTILKTIIGKKGKRTESKGRLFSERIIAMSPKQETATKVTTRSIFNNEFVQSQ